MFPRESLFTFPRRESRMSYLVFARKWRPQTFSEVAAQEHITVTLQNAIASGRAGHAYLFSGPRGVGKTTTARILAKGLNCERGPTPDPCLVCPACLQITAGSHLDVLEIDGASNRGIDEIRDLREKARYAAAGGGYKVYIIDEVHMLTKEAFNALLKTLEEPPEKVVFIFATTEPRKVPATILSRCQRFDFRRIPFRVMADYIATEAAREGITVSRDALGLVCRASGGSMRDALSLMDQLVSFAGKDITSDTVARLLGLVESDLLAGVARAVLTSSPSTALDLLEEASLRGYSIEEFNEAFSLFLRNMMLAATGAEKGIVDLSEGEMELVRSSVAGVPDIAVLNVMRIMAAASAQIREGADPRITIEGALLTASRLSSVFDLSHLPKVTAGSSTAAVPCGEAAPLEVGTAVARPDGPPEPEPVKADPALPAAGSEETARVRENEEIKEIAGLFDLIPEPGGEGVRGEP